MTWEQKLSLGGYEGNHPWKMLTDFLNIFSFYFLTGNKNNNTTPDSNQTKFRVNVRKFKVKIIKIANKILNKFRKDLRKLFVKFNNTMLRKWSGKFRSILSKLWKKKVKKFGEKFWGTEEEIFIRFRLWVKLEKVKEKFCTNSIR